MHKKTLTLTLLFALAATAAVAATINVPGNYTTIQAAISAASPGDTILVAPGTFVETGQIVINKNLSIVGSGSYQTTIKPAQDTGNSGDSRGWILVQSGKHLNLSRVSLDASGRNVYQAIRVLGTATVTDCAFSNIRYAKYLGMALATMGNVSVLRCRFSNIERVGALLFGGGVTDAVVSGCIYSGKGDGDWLDYAFEIGGGARATISNNVITDCRGVASSDGSTSAGVLATTYYGAGTTGKITGNTILNCSSGIAVGYNSSDTSAVYANYNNLLCPYGVKVVGNAAVNAENNWWGTIDGSGVAARVSGNADYDPWRVVPVPQVFTFADDFAAFAFAQASPADRFMGSGAWKGYGVKSELYMTPDYLFLRPVKVNELLSISYATRKPGGQSTPDWYALIYTMPYAGGDATWYGNRLNAEPMYSYNLNAPANVWNIWSTDPGTNQLCFFDAKRTYAGFYGGPTLAQVAAGPIDWSSFPNSGGSVTHDYASQTVKYLTLATGNPWAAQFFGFIDDARVWLKSGQAAIIDLETASAADALYLTVNPGTMFVKPGDQVEVVLNMSNLSAPAAGYQAFVSFDTAKLTFSSGTYTAYPFGQHLTTLSPYQSGYIVASAGVLMNPPQPPTAAQSVLATLEFTAGAEGVTRVTFASAGTYEGFVSRITDTNGDPIQTTTVESPAIVIDGTAPVITCPPSINRSSDPGKCGAAINVGEATATDALAGVASIVGVRNDGKALTEDYPVGTTTVTWTATDRAGNTAQCQQTVTVTDGEMPTIEAPGDVVVFNDAGKCYATNVDLGTPVTSDNCGVASVTNDAPARFPVGETTVTWTVYDVNGNSAVDTQKVTVIDNELPSIICPTDLFVSNDPGVCSWTPPAVFETFNDQPDLNVWTVDRKAPAAFESITFDGDKRLRIGIAASDYQTNQFYNTQGRSRAFSPPCVTKISGKLYIPQDWASNKRRSDIWGVTRDAWGDISGYPIIGFANTQGNNPVLRVFSQDTDQDPSNGYQAGWRNLNLTITYDKWYKFDIVIAGDRFEFYVDDVLALTDSATFGSLSFSAMILQGYNFAEDYSIYWDNVQAGPLMNIPTVDDNCDIAGITYVRSDTEPLDAPYPVGETTITWTVTDIHGNSESCEQTVTVNDTENPVITCPGDITVYALPNSSEATVDPGTATATDNCGVKSVVGTRSDSKELDDPYPVGTTVITWTATDNSNNTSQCQQTVTVLNKNQAEITVQLEGVSAASLTREIEFQFGGDGSGSNNTTVYASVVFTLGTGTVTVDIPAGVQWTCVTAKDRQHTLRSQTALQVAGSKYVASFTGSDKLIGGDLTNDNLVDILDFGVFAGQFGTAYPGHRPWPNRDADISGDGQVGSADFSYIQTHFLNRGKALCGGAPDASAGLAMPVTSIRLRDLSRIIGPQAAYAADVNKDGVIDLKDVELFVQRSIAGAR